MRVMFFDFAMLAMCAFSGCILMKPLYIMGVRNISFHKFPSLGNTFILMLVCSRCMLVTGLDTSGYIIGDQFHQSVG